MSKQQPVSRIELDQLQDLVDYAPTRVHLDHDCFADFSVPSLRCGTLPELRSFDGDRGILLKTLVACNGHSISKEDLGNFIADQKKENRPKNPVKKASDAVYYLRKNYCIPHCQNAEKCIRDDGKKGYWFCPSEHFHPQENIRLQPGFVDCDDASQCEETVLYSENLLPCGSYRDRAEQKELLLQAFLNNNRIHVISGEHGSGKSELARAFATTCNFVNEEIRKELQFCEIFIAPYKSGGLRETLASLPICGSLEHGKDDYIERLQLLTKAMKPSLLILDNCNNPRDEEFDPDAQVYRDLMATGCHVLITSRQDLLHRFGFPQTTLQPMDLPVLMELFGSIAGRSYLKQYAQLKELIEVLLYRNVYLVVLAANLAKTRPLEDIIASFREGRTKELEETFGTSKDRNTSEEQRLIDHTRCLFDLGRWGETPMERKVLHNLLLLPPAGIPQEEFLNDAFPLDEQESVRQVLLELHHQNWVLFRDQKLILPGLVRELLLEKLAPLDLSLVQPYLTTIGDQLHTELYHDRMEHYMELAAACELFRDSEPVPVAYALLISDLASDYELLSRQEEAYHFAKLTAELLDRLPDVPRSRQEQTDLAMAYNHTGYSLYRNHRHKDAPALTQKMLRTADQIISRLLEEPGPDTLRLARIQAKIHGNMGASLLEQKRFDEALEIHLNSISFRQALLEQHPRKEISLLLAAAYKSVAMDYYYRSQDLPTRQALNDLILSCEYHRQATELYAEYLEPQHYELIVAYNRYANTFWATLSRWLSLSERSRAAYDVEFLHHPARLLLALMERMKTFVMHQIRHQPENMELANSIKNTKKLLEMAHRMKDEDIDLFALLDLAQAVYVLGETLPNTAAFAEHNLACGQLCLVMNQVES